MGVFVGTDRVNVTTESGVVAGVRDRGLVRFRGVPFAAAPFGANRFRHPQPVQAWDGVRDAAARGVGAPSRASRMILSTRTSTPRRPARTVSTSTSGHRMPAAPVCR